MIEFDKAFALTFAMSIATVGCVGRSPHFLDGVEPLEIYAAAKGDELKVTIINTGSEDMLIYSPLALRPLPDEPGLEFLLEGSDGQPRGTCAFIEPSSDAGPVALESGQTASRGFDFSYLAKIYCLESGRYKVQVILHIGESGSGSLKEFRSGTVHFTVP